jgi:hypothetical protein
MSADYDSPWKEVLNEYFEAFLAFFFPEIHRDIDWSRGYRPLDKEFQQLVREGEQGRRIADMLVQVWLKDGTEEWILIHVEVQGRAERNFGERILDYNYRIFARYGRPVVSLVILADEDPDWLPTGFSYGRWGCHTGIRFAPRKLLDYIGREAVLEADPNPFAIVVLAHLKSLETRGNDAERFAWKVRLVRGLYNRGLTAENVRHLFRVIDWMINLPAPLALAFRQNLERLEEERHMPYVTSIERMAREEGMEKGIEVGIEKGIEKGREQGLQKGREGMLVAIEALLELKFQAEAPGLMPEVRAITDVDVLSRVCQGIKTANTVDDLRRLWTK